MGGMTRAGLRLAILMDPCSLNMVMNKQHHRAAPCELLGWSYKPWEWSGE